MINWIFTISNYTATPL